MVGVVKMEEKDTVYISTADIAEYVWTKLLDQGHVPTSDEVFDLAEIFFDFLVDREVIQDVTEEED